MKKVEEIFKNMVKKEKTVSEEKGETQEARELDSFGRGTYQIYVDWNLRRNQVEFFLHTNKNIGSSDISFCSYIAQPIKLIPKPHEWETIEPFLSLPFDQAQNLMDGLWNSGVRPSQLEREQTALPAVQKHLSDMRKLVQSTMKINLD